MSPRENEVYQLFVLVEGGIERIRLHAGPSPPPECQETHGFVMTADDAMALALIPHEIESDGVCQCRYRPVR